MNLSAWLRWRTPSPGLHTVRTGFLALLGAILVVCAALQIEKAIWPNGTPRGAWHGLEVPVFVLVFLLALIGIVSIPLGMVVLVREHWHRVS
jgi:hypothetical protein